MSGFVDIGGEAALRYSADPSCPWAVRVQTLIPLAGVLGDGALIMNCSRRYLPHVVANTRQDSGYPLLLELEAIRVICG